MAHEIKDKPSSAGLDVATSLRTCTRSSPNLALREIMEQAAQQTTAGTSLLVALAVVCSMTATITSLLAIRGR